MNRDVPFPDIHFAPLRDHDGFLPLEDFGLIGDGSTAALVGRDGAVWWMCVPHFDSPPLFCRILDRQRGGAFEIAPQEPREARQYYLPDSGVLVTELRCASGTLRITDALTLRSGADLNEDTPAGRGELLRMVQVLSGRITLRLAVEPWGGAQVQRWGNRWRICCLRPDDFELQLHLSGLPEGHDGLSETVQLAEGERLDCRLRWGEMLHRHAASTPDELLRSTVSAWQRWLRDNLHYDGPQEPLLRRSAITLKMLDYFENGAIVAAPTSSLPERLGGERNWDYRYTWIRDAAFSVYALRRIGMVQEAWQFLSWVLDILSLEEGAPRVVYKLDGSLPLPEREEPELSGYRGSRPVRWGNGAAQQQQHDVYGEILDCAYQWMAHGGPIEPPLWDRLRACVEAARSLWRQPDHGIWEVRCEPASFTYSVALCHVALDRGARIAEHLGLPGDIDGWRAEAREIHSHILQRAWDPQKNSLVGRLDGGGLDASLLSLPLRRVLPADDPRMLATTEAIVRHLSAGNGLLYRYLPDESPDGLKGHEGAFLLCSFWWVDNLAMQGRLDEAHELYHSLCARAGHLGLLPEQIDPGSGAFLGNYPQAFSHVGLISSGINLWRAVRPAPDGRSSAPGPA